MTTTPEEINTVLSKTDKETYRRLLAQNSSAVAIDKTIISQPVYFVHCYYCGWGARDFRSLEAVERRAEDHLKENIEHAGCILTAFDLLMVPVKWR